MPENSSQGPRTVSIENQMPEDLFDAMREFIRLHPQWDQYRLMQAALAGFLFQNGATERSVARHYLNGLFHREPRPLPPADLPSGCSVQGEPGSVPASH